MRGLVVFLVTAFLLLTSNTLLLVPLKSQTVAAQDFSNVVAKSRPAISLVFVEEHDGSFASGTGFGVAGASVIVTAAHVVSDVKSMIVRYGDGSKYPAKPVFVWQEDDVALIQVQKPPAIGLSGRKTSLRVGEPALVIGYPLVDKLGISEVSVTQGIVSAIHPDAIQLNVAVNPGNSGGPVLDSSGTVIGLVTGALPGTGLAIASPWSQVKAALEAFAQDTYPVAVTLAGKRDYVTGWIEQGAVMINANVLADFLGGIVFWDAKTKTLILAANGKRLRFVVGSRTLDVDGQQTVLPLPMGPDRRIPLKSVVAVFGGSVQVNLASFTVGVTMPATAVAPKPAPIPTPAPAPAPSTPTPQAPPPPPATVPATTGPTLDPGRRELHPGSGAGDLRFGMDGVEVSKLLGPPSSRQIWKAVVGLMYQPVQLIYQPFGMSVLMANGKLWGVVATTKDWVLQPYSVRVGETRQDAIKSIGYDYESQTEGEITAVHYKRKGISLFIRNDTVQTILVFIPER